MQHVKLESEVYTTVLSSMHMTPYSIALTVLELCIYCMTGTFMTDSAVCTTLQDRPYGVYTLQWRS
jgi:hypothetical protein